MPYSREWDQGKSYGNTRPREDDDYYAGGGGGNKRQKHNVSAVRARSTTV